MLIKLPFSQVTKVEKVADGNFTVHLSTGQTLTEVDCVLFAIGRAPRTDIGLDKAGVELDGKGILKITGLKNGVNRLYQG